MYAIYGNIYHKYTPNVSIYSIHGSYGYIWNPHLYRIPSFVSSNISYSAEKSTIESSVSLPAARHV